MRDYLAKLTRVVTIPPVLALSMLLILWYRFGESFANLPVLAGVILFLVVIPACAYPVAGFKKDKTGDTRKRQRKLAFLFSFLGYTGALVLGLVMDCGKILRTILTAYFVAVLFLTLLNKVFHIKASGHACSCVLPFLFLIAWLGMGAAALCLLIYSMEFWASVFLKRHTAKEFLLGSATALVAFACVNLLALF